MLAITSDRKFKNRYMYIDVLVMFCTERHGEHSLLGNFLSRTFK